MLAFGDMAKVLSGHVVSGIGDFGHWMELLADHYARVTRMDLVPGTLNIELDEPYHLPPERCYRLAEEDIGTGVAVSLQLCGIFGRKAFIVRTDANAEGRGQHPPTIIEIATDFHIRTEYKLKDGDEIQVVVD